MGVVMFLLIGGMEIFVSFLLISLWSSQLSRQRSLFYLGYLINENQPENHELCSRLKVFLWEIKTHWREIKTHWLEMVKSDQVQRKLGTVIKNVSTPVQ
jgi:hypothetical protein